MRISLDDLEACSCGCIFDFTVAGKREKRDYYDDTYIGKCPACKKEFSVTR
jgi:hypothetical protein